MQIDQQRFKNEEKKLKRHHREHDVFRKIKLLFTQLETFEDLCNNPLLRMYHFEELKYELYGYYSCYLSKNGGVIRLIFKIHKESNAIELIYISMDHYEDFKRTLKEGVLS